MKDSEGAKVVEVDTEGSTELPHQVAFLKLFLARQYIVVFMKIALLVTFKQMMILIVCRWKRAPKSHLFLVESESGCDTSNKNSQNIHMYCLYLKRRKRNIHNHQNPSRHFATLTHWHFCWFLPPGCEGVTALRENICLRFCPFYCSLWKISKSDYYGLFHSTNICIWCINCMLICNIHYTA